MVFLDSNVWTYAFISQDVAKMDVALAITNRALLDTGFCISSQVVSECANVLFRKGGYTTPQVVACIGRMEQIDTIVQVTTHIVRRAAEIKTIYGLQFYDAQIIAAAEKAGCDEVWSEDMGDGQTYCGVKCVNPFAADFTGLGE